MRGGTNNPLSPLLAPVIALWGVQCSAQATQTSDFAALEKTVIAELQETHTPGAAIAVVSGDRVVFAKGFGLSNVETKEPVTPEMLFRLGSTTKMFTATALVMLSEQGKLRMDQPLGRYIKKIDPAIAALTANQVLSHTAGLSDEAPMPESHDDAALAAEIRGWKASRLFAPAGAIFSYSNSGYWLAGLAVEEVSGKPFAEQVSDSVFRPLGMQRSTFRPSVAMTYPMALGHDATPEGALSVVRPFANNVRTWPAGSMFSNVHELARFTIAFMNGGRLEGKQVLSPSLIAALAADHAKVPGGDASYGYGLMTYTHRGVRVVGHGGARSGYGSEISMVPAQKFAVIVVGNRSGASLPKTVEAAMEAVLKLEPPEPDTVPKSKPMTAAELERYVGNYANGSAKVSVETEGGKFYLRSGSERYQVTKVDDGRFEMIFSDGERAPIVFVTGPARRAAYLYFGVTSYRRTRE